MILYQFIYPPITYQIPRAVGGHALLPKMRIFWTLGPNKTPKIWAKYRGVITRWVYVGYGLITVNWYLYNVWTYLI